MRPMRDRPCFQFTICHERGECYAAAVGAGEQCAGLDRLGVLIGDYTQLMIRECRETTAGKGSSPMCGCRRHQYLKAACECACVDVDNHPSSPSGPGPMMERLRGYLALLITSEETSVMLDYSPKATKGHLHLLLRGLDAEIHGWLAATRNDYPHQELR